MGLVAVQRSTFRISEVGPGASAKFSFAQKPSDSSTCETVGKAGERITLQIMMGDTAR